MTMQLNPVVFLSPYAEEQDTASKRIHEAFDIVKNVIKYLKVDIILYQSDGQVILGRNRSDIDERVYEYVELNFSTQRATALFDMLGKHAVNGEIPKYGPQVHLDMIDRYSKRFYSKKSSARFLAYAFVQMK